MAKGQTTTINQIQKNMPAVTVSKLVELIVVNNALAIDLAHMNPGVNSLYQ